MSTHTTIALPQNQARIYTLFSQNPSLKLLSVLTLISCIILFLATWNIPQSMYSDPGWQLKAIQQFLAGQSPSLNHLVEAQPSDISQNVSRWISTWAIGTNLLVYPQILLGMSFGHALRIITIVSIVIGSLGWMRWITLFNTPTIFKILLALFFPWIRYVSNPLYLFSAEILTYAAAPWTLLAVYNLAQVWKHERKNRTTEFLSVLAAGLTLGSLYIVKYSAIFIGIGCLIYLGIITLRHLSRRITFELVIVGILFAAPVAITTLLNLRFSGSANLVASSLGVYFDWRHVLHLVANPALAITDAESVLNYVLLHPSFGVTHDNTIVALIGLPGGLAILWFALRRAQGEYQLLAQIVFVTSLILLLFVWSFSHAVPNYDARYLAQASFALLPLILEQGYAVLIRSRQILRFFLVALAAFYIVLPLIYGVVSVVGKQSRYVNYVTTSNDFYNPLLSATNIETVRSIILNIINPQIDVIYLTDPISALDIPGRVIIRHADFTPIEELEKETFTSTVAIRVHALLPARFEENGKGRVIRASFPQVTDWSGQAIEASDLIFWSGTIQP